MWKKTVQENPQVEPVRYSEETNVYYKRDSKADEILSESREEITQRKAQKSTTKYKFYVSDSYDSLNYNPILNQLEQARQKVETFGSLMVEDCLRLVLYVVAALLIAVVCIAMEVAIHKLGHFKYSWLSDFIMDNLETGSYELPLVFLTRFVTVALPIMVGSGIVVYIAPYAAGGGVAQCIAYLNGIRVPRILSIRGMIVKFFSTVCCCISGLAGGKEGPAMHIGATIGGSLPSILPWLKFKSDHERRDLAAAGFGAGIAIVFGAPIGGMLLSLEEGVSFWDINLMWKMYLCCLVGYAFGSIFYSVILGIEVKMNNPQLSTIGGISRDVTEYELFELLPFAVQAVIGGLLGAFLIKVHTHVITFRKKILNTKRRKMLVSLVVSILLTGIQMVSIRGLRNCSKLAPGELKPLGNDTLEIRAHQLYCGPGEHSDMSLLFQQTQSELLRTFFGTNIIKTESLAWFSLIYVLMLVMTWCTTMSYGIFVPQLIFGAAWGRMVGSVMKSLFPGAKWAHPGKYAYVGAAAQLCGVVGKTFSILMIMVEASGSISFAFPLMVVVVITKLVVAFFVESVYHVQMLMQGMPFLSAKPPPLSLDMTAAAVMSQSLVTLPLVPAVAEVVEVIRTTRHHGFPVVDLKNRNHLLGLILRQQLLILLKYKAYKYPPPKTIKEMCECREIYLKLDRKRLDEQYILGEVKAEDLALTLDLTLYYDAFPTTVTDVTPAVRAYSVFRELALRHLVVVSTSQPEQPVGVITRKDLAKFHTFENFFRMGVVEMLVKK